MFYLSQPSHSSLMFGWKGNYVIFYPSTHKTVLLDELLVGTYYSSAQIPHEFTRPRDSNIGPLERFGTDKNFKCTFLLHQGG